MVVCVLLLVTATVLELTQQVLTVVPQLAAELHVTMEEHAQVAFVIVLVHLIKDPIVLLLNALLLVQTEVFALLMLV